MHKKTIQHLIINILLNATIAVVIFESYSWYKYNVIALSDLIYIWPIGVLVVGIFIAFICWPILHFIIKKTEIKTSIIISAALGLIYVFVFFAAFTRYPITIEFMVSKAWLYYLIFSLIGGIYGLSYFKNNNA